MEALGDLTRNVRWAVKGLVPEDSMGMIFGASGTYKSFIAIDLAMHMVHEMEWAGKRTKKGAIAYLAAEGGAGIYRRLLAWHNQFGLVPDHSINICITPLLLSASEEVAAMKAAIAALTERPKLVVIDTLSQTFNGDENSSSDIGDYLRMINTEIRAAFNCTVIVVHHTGHSAAERPRGSSAITANLDFILGVFRPDPERPIARVSVHKMKDGDKVDDLYFEMTRSVLGHDEDGDEISSLVARHTAAPDVSEGNGRFSKYDALCVKALASGGLVSEHDIKKLADKGDNETAVTKGIKRALDGMFKRGLIKSIGSGVWQRIA
jgi:hypothetical protein